MPGDENALVPERASIPAKRDARCLAQHNHCIRPSRYHGTFYCYVNVLRLFILPLSTSVCAMIDL